MDAATIEKGMTLMKVTVAAAITVATATIAMTSYFASAADVRSLAASQSEQVQVLKQNNARTLMFQHEYYTNQVNRLKEEKTACESLSKKTKRAEANSPVPVPCSRDFTSEIFEAQMKKDFVQKQIVDGSK